MGPPHYFKRLVTIAVGNNSKIFEVNVAWKNEAFKYKPQERAAGEAKIFASKIVQTHIVNGARYISIE